jgi:hypothetical protein
MRKRMGRAMKPAQVRRKLARIQKQQEKWDLAEKELKELCSHPDASKKHRGDTGNWDRNEDSYWIEYKCPDCGKFWTVDQ